MIFYINALCKKPFCFSFPPENSRIKERKSRCRYQNNLPAAHRVFLNYPCQKSYGRKIQARNNRFSRKIPAFWYLKGDFLHSRARKGNARKSQQVTTDTAGHSAASNCRYGRIIPASNYQIRPENSAASNYRNGWKIPRRNAMNAIALAQGGSGAMVEYLLPNLKVKGSPPPCTQILFRYTAGKFRWRRKLNRKFRPTCQTLFWLYVWIESVALGPSRLVTVWALQGLQRDVV